MFTARTWPAAIALMTAYFALSSTALADGLAPLCTEGTRDCMIAIVNSYYDSFENQRAVGYAFLSNYKRVENGKFYPREVDPNPTWARRVDTGTLGFSPARRPEGRFYIDMRTHDILTFVRLPVPKGTSKIPGTDENYPEGPFTVHLMERFRLEHGIMTEVEAIYHNEVGTMTAQSAAPMNGLSYRRAFGAGDYPIRPTSFRNLKPLAAPPLCVVDTRDCMITTATAYITGTLKYDLSKVPFASEWVRTENGHVTGTDKGPPPGALPRSLNWVNSGEATRYFVDDDSHDVVAISLYRSSAFTIPGWTTQGQPVGPKPMTIHMVDRFHVERGLLTEVEEIYSYTPGLTAKNWEP